MKLALVTVVLFFYVQLFSQRDSLPLKYDTTYYEKYTQKLIITPYLVKNLTAFRLLPGADENKVPYYSNSPGGLGLRLGYDWLAIGAAYSPGFFDPEYKKQRGKTKTLNLNTSFLARNFIVDVFFQNYKSLYLKINDDRNTSSGGFYVRPDIKTNMFGATGSYVFNGKKFSARDAFKFDTRQKKSAGSFIAGLEFLTGNIKSDSALIPAFYTLANDRYKINKLQYMSFGPNLGYGYTWVIKKSFFINGVATFNADAGNTKATVINSDVIDDKWSFMPSLNLRGGLGYNKTNWELALSYYSKRLYFGKNNAPLNSLYYNDYRLSFTRRINAGKRIPRIVNWAGNIIEDLGFGFLIR